MQLWHASGDLAAARSAHKTISEEWRRAHESGRGFPEPAVALALPPGVTLQSALEVLEHYWDVDQNVVRIVEFQ